MIFTVKEVLEITGGRLLAGSEKTTISRAVIDSREAREGDLFFPLAGEKTDGHHYILDALERGAAGALAENWALEHFKDSVFPEGKTVVVVEDSLRCLQELARYHRNRFNIHLVAVTGSNGKTTTKDFIAAVLAQRYHVLKTEGNLNNHIGLPLMLLRLTAEHQAVVLEMGMSGYGEIALLASLSRPTAGVITNIGEAHLEMLGSRENIARAKGELLEFMGPDDPVYLNVDDLSLRLMGERFNGRVFFYGFAEKAHLRALKYWPSEPGYCFEALLPGGGSETFWIPLPGQHNVYNALAATAVGNGLGLTGREIRAGLAAAEFSGMRMERTLTNGGYWIINDAYNASPTSVKSVLNFLEEWSGPKKKIAVLGDMLELGKDSQELHLEVGRYVQAKGIDFLVTVGEQARFIARGAVQAGFPRELVFCCPDVEEAVSCLDVLLEKEAVLLIKGSRGMRLERIAESLIGQYNG